MKTILIIVSYIISFSLHVASVWASQESIGPNGIHSNVLNLTGNGVAIGQLELGRPGDPNFDTDMALFNSTVEPEMVFRRGLLGFDASADNVLEVSAHAVEVAGIMISTDAIATGVAPGAALYSVAGNFTSTGGVELIYQDAAVSANHLATLPGKNLRAINMSFNVSSGSDNADGNSLLTSFVDWSASTHDILYVTSGFEAGASGPLPSDNFNGITVGFSEKDEGVYKKVDGGNDFTADDFSDRTFVDLIAPGRNIQLATQGNVITTIPDPVRVGTSLAAPHVTGTVALLQQFAEIQIGAAAPNWGPNARRHEVMKAVLMNSADKLEDDGSIVPVGSLLGMERTVLDQNGDNWLVSEAFSFVNEDPDLIPLDDQMGAGHLNAKRALQQFVPGESDLTSGTATVPTIGWDYGHTSFAGDLNRYVIDQELQGDDVISITLAWDREVKLTVDDGVFNAGDTFQVPSDPNTSDDLINDLDLFLVETATQTPMLSSISFEGTLEHIFASVPFTGVWEIWVFQDDADIAGGQDYALAWWYGLAPEIEIPIAGDFDGNGMVDAADLAQWEGDYGINGDSDADGDGDSDGADFLVWQQNFGTGVAMAANSTAVPEPAACLLLSMGLAFWRPRSS